MQTPGTIAMNEVTTFKGTNVRLTEGGKTFNQYKTLQKIVRYTRSEYNNSVNNGSLFYNISNQRIPLYAKSIDANTKDFLVVGLGKTNFIQQWIINVRYRKWAREEGFALTLDEDSTSIATFGSCVWKKVKQPNGEVTLEESNLQNLYFDPTAKNIIDSPVVEIHYLTEAQIQNKYPKKYKDIIAKAEKGRDEEDNTSETETPKYKIWERWGWYEGKYMHHIGSGAGEGEVVAFDETIKIDKKTSEPIDFPYYDFHGERVKGRWLGLGVVERLFAIQKQVNKLINQNDEANDIASLLLFKDDDPNASGNLLEGVRSGTVIPSKELQELGISNRFLQGFLAQLNVLENKADQLCYIQESISGERPPSGVPFRAVAMASRGAVSTFDYIKKHIVEKMGHVLVKEFFPELVKRFNLEDMIEIAEDENDVRLYEELMVAKAKKEFQIERAKKGMVVFEEELQAIEDNIRGNMQISRKMFPIGKRFFNFKYGIIMNPSNESMDKVAMNAAIDSALEYMISAPAAVNTPLFQQKLASNNIPPFRLTPMQQQEMQQTAGAIPNKEAPQDRLSAEAAV